MTAVWLMLLVWKKRSPLGGEEFLTSFVGVCHNVLVVGRSGYLFSKSAFPIIAVIGLVSILYGFFYGST